MTTIADGNAAMIMQSSCGEVSHLKIRSASAILEAQTPAMDQEAQELELVGESHDMQLGISCTMRRGSGRGTYPAGPSHKVSDNHQPSNTVFLMTRISP
jgi:hypothetical protein